MQSEADNSQPQSNLHLINTSLEAMKRLLSRFGPDGSLAQASPTLIRMSIEAALKEVKQFQRQLGTLKLDANSTEQDVHSALLDVAAKLKVMLDAQERALNELSVGASSLTPHLESP